MLNFFPADGLAAPALQTETADLEETVQRLMKELDAASSQRLPFDADTTGRLLATRLQIVGNTVLSKNELLRDLPLVYNQHEIDPVTGKPKLDPVSEIPILSGTYNFRSLAELIVNPGPLRGISARAVLGFAKYILSVYEDRGYRGILVSVPRGTLDVEGRLKGDILTIQVLEMKIAHVHTARFSFDQKKTSKAILLAPVIKHWSPVQEGDVIHKRKLDNFVKLLNLNPDRYVSAVVSRSNEPNALDLTYDMYEESPWHVYVQADDSGTKQRQWAPRMGVINTNVTGIDDRLSVQFQAPWEKGLDDEYAAFGVYDLPVLTPRLRVGVYGGYSKFDINTEGIGFLGNGSLFGSTVSYNIFQAGDWFVDLTGSLSRESSRVTPSLGIGSDVDMNLWGGGVRLHRRTERDMSSTMLSLDRTESMGGSDQGTFDAARLGTNKDFAIYSVSAAHTQYLDQTKTHRIKTSLRIVDPQERLVPAKMTVFGGLYTVRGYEEDEIVADGGFLFSAQYEFDLAQYERFPRKDIFRPGMGDEDDPWLRKLAPLVFVDIGRAQIEDPLPGEDRIQELASVGAGAIVDIKGNFTGALYYGWPLRSTLDTNKGKGKLNASLTYRFK